MPIEIRELVIKASVVDNAEDGREVKPDQVSVSNDMAHNKRQIIEECVEQVLAILEQKRDR